MLRMRSRDLRPRSCSVDRARAVQPARGATELSLSIKGSDTMVLLGQRWAEQYMASASGRGDPGYGRRFRHRHRRADQRHHGHLPVVAADEGSGAASRFATKYGAPPHEIVVAKDGLAIYVARVESGARAHDRADQGDLHGSRYPTGRQSAARTTPISIYGRENSSGTYEYFKESRARRRRLRGHRSNPSGHGRGRERRRAGPERHRLRRRRLRQRREGVRREGRREAVPAVLPTRRERAGAAPTRSRATCTSTCARRPKAGSPRSSWTMCSSGSGQADRAPRSGTSAHR